MVKHTSQTGTNTGGGVCARRGMGFGGDCVTKGAGGGKELNLVPRAFPLERGSLLENLRGTHLSEIYGV